MPAERNTAEIEGQPLHYLRAGSGPSLLLLHGLLGGSFCWRLNVDALSHGHTIIAVDLPGLGACDAPRDLDCSMVAQAQRVLSLLEQLKLENVDVVGSSWGGAIAMFVAAQSRRVRSLLLWGTRDGAVDLRSAEQLRRALPASGLKLIEGAGHLPFEETPDEFNRLVLDFIERTRVGSGSACSFRHFG